MSVGSRQWCHGPRLGCCSPRSTGARCWGSSSFLWPTTGDGLRILATTLGLAKSLRGGESPHALRPTDTGTFREVVAVVGAVARAGADSANQQDARYYGGYWTEFCAECNTP